VMRMHRSILQEDDVKVLCAAMLAAFVLASAPPALAQSGSAAPWPSAADLTRPVRIYGPVTAVRAHSISVRNADGRVFIVAVAPSALLVFPRLIDASEIRPGDFISTMIDRRGHPGEIKVHPQGVRSSEGSYPVPQINMTLINATITEVVDVT